MASQQQAIIKSLQETQASSIVNEIFPTHPFTLANSLPHHPLFEPERIKRLLRAMPREFVEIRAVESRGTEDGNYIRGKLLKEADPVETFERLEERPAWMLLHQTWAHDRDYNQLLQEYIAELSEMFGEMRPGVNRIGCWMFLSSGNSVVHFHADPDQSFLNQIRGSKTVYVYPTRVLAEEIVEDLVFTEDQGKVVYRPDYAEAMFEPVRLTPGDSVFLPLYAPHRVTNDGDLCISWNVGFHTRHSSRRRAAHYVNHELRRWGLKPQSFGEQAGTDTFKSYFEWPLRAKKKLARLIGIKG